VSAEQTQVKEEIEEKSDKEEEESQNEGKLEI
jgi:hypothetical protein